MPRFGFSRPARCAAWLLAALALPGGASAQSWSPQNADVLFTSSRDGNAEIYLLKAGSAEWINLTNHPASDNWAEWSPDGKSIVFQSKRSGNLDLWRMDADGSNVVQLTDDPESDYLPVWSPGGDEIYFSSWRREGDEERANHTYRMRFDGTVEKRVLAESPGVSAGIAISPDGAGLILTREIDGKGADLFLANPEGKIEKQLTSDGKDGVFSGSPVFSPDGKSIAFYADHDGRSDLVVLGLASGERRVVLAEGKNWYPRFSPDGRYLLYTAPAGEDEEDLDLFAVPVEGGSPALVVGGPGREMEGRWPPAKRGSCSCPAKAGKE